MVTYRASFDHWADYSFDDLHDYTFDLLAEPSHCLELSASIVLAPLTDDGPRQFHIITPRLKAYAAQFAYVLELMYQLRLSKKIEFVTGEDLDNLWGRVYELRRLYGESDADYRKRLQVYLLQIAGSGTKPSVEQIVSILCEWPNSCRVDTYWPGYARVYITNAYARVKARDRLAMLNAILPNTLAAGMDYRIYIPYVDIQADIALQGPAYNEIEADIALQGPVTTTFEASVIFGGRTLTSLDADMLLGSYETIPIQASVALQHDDVLAELDADVALSAQVENTISAELPLMGAVSNPLMAYERLYSSPEASLEADIALQGKRLRPIEARIRLEAA